MIAKWDSGFPVACDIACILSGISRMSFSDPFKRSTSLNGIGRTSNLTLPVTVVVMVLDGVMVLVAAVEIT